MSSLVLMRILESVPQRYDGGMQLLTLGGWRRSHRALAERAVRAPGAEVLEIGCGTGALTEQLLARGARVVALDQSPEMLDRARQRLQPGAGDDRLELVECTAAELDRFGEARFDAVAASLVLSEMAPQERAWVLRAAARALRPGGVVAVADEVRPRGPVRRALHALLRGPLALLAWIVTGRVSHALDDPEAELRAAGLVVRESVRSRFGSSAVVVAERP